MEPIQISLKNKKQVTLRCLKSDDKEKLLEMFNSLSDEALYWGMPPYTEETIERWITNLSNLIPLVAVYKKRIVGYGAIFKYSHPRRIGTSGLGMYLHQDFHNVGLGSSILERLLEQAKNEKLTRIGLHVIEGNTIAVHLYKKFGFEVEGKMKQAYRGADDKYHDELVMGKILGGDK